MQHINLSINVMSQSSSLIGFLELSVRMQSIIGVSRVSSGVKHRQTRKSSFRSIAINCRSCWSLEGRLCNTWRVLWRFEMGIECNALADVPTIYQHSSLNYVNNFAYNLRLSIIHVPQPPHRPTPLNPHNNSLHKQTPPSKWSCSFRFLYRESDPA